MTERSVAIIGKGMIGISMAVLFTGNGIPTIVLAKNAEVGLEKYRTYYRDLVGQGLVTERQAAACERRLSFTESYQDLADVEIVFECVTEKLAVKYAPADSRENRDSAIDREWAPLCMLEMEVEHLSGKEAIELVRQRES